jgi:molecular chaperone Hsp33
MSSLMSFIFEGLPVRGALVRVTAPWQELLARRKGENQHPPAVRALLGEMVAAGLLMQSNIKFNGSLVLQVVGDGPVKLAVAEVQGDGSFRATAKVVGEVGSEGGLEALVNLHGQGRCAITLDPNHKQPGQQPYQGVVPLHGDQREPLQRVQQVLEHYMLQSEQLDTRLILAANDEVAAGLLIQRMPVQGTGNIAGQTRRDEDEIGVNESFNRIALLSATLTPEELLTLPLQEILQRLYWEETLRVFEPMRPHFACTCSRHRVSTMLLGLGREESESLIAERGEVEVGCEFCGAQYRFDVVDVGALFTPLHEQVPGGDGVQ